MTAEIPVITAAGPEYATGGMAHIETTLLESAPWNARKTMDRAALDELMASIEDHGIQVPLIVRLLSTDGYYEVVAGHRRLAAARNAGLKTVPCIVRDLSDDQAQELGLIDNLQREDVPAMEEAVAFAELLARIGSIEAVAARVGKDQGYVAKRLKLCSLSLAGQDAAKNRLITIDHALVLARLGADEQDAALKWCLDHSAGAKTSVDKVIEDRVQRQQQAEKDRAEKDASRWRYTWEPQSVQKLKDHIAAESGTPLSRAPWDLESAVLIADAPACSDCPQNTKANAPLFGDLEIGEPTCTDGGCFKEKTQAFVRIQLGCATVKPGDAKDGVGGNALRVSWKSTSMPPRMGSSANPKYPDGPAYVPIVKLDQIFKAGQWEEAKKKSCEHARVAVTVDWSDAGDRGYMGGDKKLRKPGEMIQVCVEPKCKVHVKDWARPKAASRSDSRDEKAEGEARERANAERIAESKIRLELASRALMSVNKLSIDAVRVLALQALPAFEDGIRPYDAVLPGVRKILIAAKGDSLEFARAVALASIGRGQLTVLAGWSAKETRKEFVAELKLLGYDASKAWDKPAAAAAKPSAKKPATKKTVLKPAAKKRIAASLKKGGRK